MSQELVGLIAKRFIQRRDVKAVQFASGAYVPDKELKHPEPHMPPGFIVSSLEAHLSGKASYGHYMLDSNNRCRLFAFDIDLEKTGAWVDLPPFNTLSDNITNEEFDKLSTPYQCNPREIWRDRRQVAARNWYKYQMGMLARKFATVIQNELHLPCATAYSGHKGVHVYAFTGDVPAEEAREGAMLVLDIMDEWKVLRGKNFFKHKLDDPFLGYPSFSVEVFPKQETLSGKGGYGNLMRLPLGRNLKSPEDPTFFLDLKTPVSDFVPHADPVQLLETGNAYL